ncbi:hypothetical protein NCCP2495_05250 [Dietzia sp. NCCP-2495]|uniref:hypothetical protein n=1 Tax=Dietzia sp. NCCP-2495 TaxID=2934675 RepID=UPI002231B852|nr:hypothetical protein [Dietzia sp. NCCP-2495]GLB62647.1 hypothetical protein NCCP2495_05250 [Dietzia sp. NCCP-2495]
MRAFDPLHPRLRVSALAVFAYGSVSRGLAYIDAPQTGLTTFVDALVPLHVWAVVWIAAGTLMIAGIWHRVIARVALNLGGTLWAVWGLSYMVATIVGDSSRGWVTGALMLTLAGSMYICAALADSAGPPPGPVIPDSEETG